MYKIFKRIIDILFSIIIIIVLFPVMIIIGLLIKIDSKGNIIFKQRRIGINNVEFIIYKFRTMRLGTPDVAKNLLGQNNSMVTKFGKFLRRTSLDEIPQLFNILKGDMSFVGPRPALYNQYDLIELRTKNGIDKIKPGITGVAQVNGREDMPLEKKVSYDKFYLNNLSLLLDIKIVIKTFFVLFSKKGTY
jgi:O-antigen biosynthesis protein WbqP